MSGSLDFFVSVLAYLVTSYWDLTAPQVKDAPLSSPQPRAPSSSETNLSQIPSNECSITSVPTDISPSPVSDTEPTTSLTPTTYPTLRRRTVAKKSDI